MRAMATCTRSFCSTRTMPGELERAKAAGEDILRYCIAVGGSITGEHGVGMEKNEMMGELFSGRFARLHRAVQDAVRSRRGG